MNISKKLSITQLCFVGLIFIFNIVGVIIAPHGDKSYMANFRTGDAMPIISLLVRIAILAIAILQIIYALKEKQGDLIFLLAGIFGVLGFSTIASAFISGGITILFTLINVVAFILNIVVIVKKN